MFLREQPGLELAGGAGTGSFGRALVPVASLSRLDRLRAALARIDWVPDLGAEIGSRTWWRGLATCATLCAAAILTAPGVRPVQGYVAPPLTGAAWEEARPLSIAPLGLGGGTGRRMAASDFVRPLAETPERPVIELTATLGDGDRLGAVLQRAGVGRADAARAAALVAQAASLSDIPSGTVLDLTLGRRTDRREARPLERLAFRARFDLNLAVNRTGDALTLERSPIAIDHTPLRITGRVGSSLYRSARAVGVPARLVESYIKALSSRVSIGRDVRADDRFDIIAEQARAATGEVQIGKLQFAGLDQGTKKIELVRWGDSGQWWDAKGQSEQRGAMGMPVAGHVTSTYGKRVHPLLGFMRMHKGMDIGAPYGAPIRAAVDGVVAQAGRAGGYGNFVKLNHAGGVATGYGHMSRIAVRAGQRVSRGQVIGYVGSTGLSTGPHLHWEVWKNGVSVNPRTISMSSVAMLSGRALREFKAKVATLLATAPAR
ncbi:M23 family metallopeptidase [uncultured Sphingomonas sp.]|mgnify:FL=1|uniref:M23 family metallopeptidase n=1 Tax=uncultured Sphingomonas sp. TaxID=158754 RepID=UPI002626729B|nr:M23 family metallopeptidase [uncultured Sphingomonas sp.]